MSDTDSDSDGELIGNNSNDFVDVGNYRTDRRVINLLLHYGLKTTLACEKEGCRGKMKLSWQTYNAGHGYIYRCGKCTRRQPIFNGTPFMGQKKTLPQFWHCLVGFCLAHAGSFGRSLSLSVNAYSGARKQILLLVKEILEEPNNYTLGGPGLFI